MTKVKVAGMGICDAPASENKRLTSYLCWKNILDRCYSEKCHKRCPTYVGCSVCDEWLLYSNFKNWYDINYRDGYQIDKDIVVKGNKIYGPHTCVMVPPNINYLVLDSKKSRGDCPVGVSYHKHGKKYRACISINNSHKHIGYFNTKEEAHEAWKIEKLKYVYEVANNEYQKGTISFEVYNALISLSF